MKIKCEIILDTDNGDYNMVFNNLTKAGEPIEYNELTNFLKKVFNNMDEQIDVTGIDSGENFTKMIH